MKLRNCIAPIIDKTCQSRHSNKTRIEACVIHDAPEVNDSAVKILGDETLMTIARELAKRVRKNTTIDWTIKENVRARLRVMVKRTLRKYGYPPDKQGQATETVIQQAEMMAGEGGN